MGWSTYSLETDFFIRESANNAVKAHSSDDTTHVYTLKDLCVCRRGMSENSEWKTLAIIEAYLIVNWFDSKSILTGTKKKVQENFVIQHLENTTYPARMDSNSPFQNLLINYFRGQW